MSRFDPSLYAAMQTGEPISTYQKTVISKVGVQVLNPHTGEPEAIILSGRPGEEESFVQNWSVEADIFFRRMNKRHISAGVIIKIDNKKEETVSILPNEQLPDSELIKIVNSKFGNLNAILQGTESEAFVSRLLTLARQEDKSERYVKAIETRLSEIQLSQIKPRE